MKSLTNEPKLEYHDYQCSYATTFSIPVLREPLIKM